MSAFDPIGSRALHAVMRNPLRARPNRAEVDLCIAVFLVGFGDARASALMQPLWQSDFCWRWGPREAGRK
jgi:hypothetical protein